MPERPRPARWPRLQGEAEEALAEAEGLKLQARLEDLIVWEMEKVKQTRKGSETYTYWIAYWREDKRRAMCSWGAPGRWMPRI